MLHSGIHPVEEVTINGSRTVGLCEVKARSSDHPLLCVLSTTQAAQRSWKSALVDIVPKDSPCIEEFPGDIKLSWLVL